MARQKRRKTIPLFWVISIIALWMLVLFETVLLLLLLRALGQMKQQGTLTQKQTPSSEEWGLAVGEKAPPFVATDYEEKPVRLDDFQGQRRILAFLLPGCSSCDGTMKALDTFVRNEDAAIMLVIGGPDRDLNHAYATEHGTQIIVLTPTPAFNGELYCLQGVPFVFVLDEAGIIRAKGVVTNSEQLDQLLARAFAPTLATY